MNPSLVDVLSWEVRVPVLAAVSWVAGVSGLGLAFGGWVQRASDARHVRRIVESARAERMEP